MTSAPAIPLLIVEDNPMYAEILQRLLPTLDPDLKFNVRWVDTAEKAKTEIDRTAYELVLLDYRLPGSDGLEVLARIRGLPGEKQPAVVMLTGMGNEAIAVQAMKSGAKDYLAKDHLDVASLTRAITSALERKRLEEQVASTTRELRARNEQMQAELFMASEIQQALLPQQHPTFPAGVSTADSALHFVSRYQPTGMVGGDFYDVGMVSNTQAGVFICDVMGHGVRAALVTAILRTLVEESQPLAADPGQFLTRINGRLLSILRQTRTPMFASAFYMVMDITSGALLFANAGHPAPLHLRGASRDVRELCATADCGSGPALGVFEDSVFPTATEMLGVHDRVLLFTDGVFEALNEHDEQFGLDRLTAAVRAGQRLPPDAFCDELLAEIRKFSRGGRFVDDVCLVAMEVQHIGAAAVT